MIKLNTLYCEENMETMRRMADNSVDSIVTDPPYELSNDGKASPNRVLFEFMFPNDIKGKEIVFSEFSLDLLLGEIFSLCFSRNIPRVLSSMPIIPMTFNKTIFGWDKNVIGKNESSTGIPNLDLRDTIDTNAIKTTYNIFFKLTDFTKFCKVINAVGSGFFSGSVGIGFSITPSCFPSFFSSLNSVVLLDDDVRILTDSFSEFIHAGGRAEDFFMTTFDLANGSIKFNTTYSALTFFSILKFCGSELVTTIPTASSLPTKFKSFSVCDIVFPTNTTNHINFCFHSTNIRNIGFMGKEWDGSKIAYDIEMWKEVLRVLKPGGHLLAFGGTRTYHRMVCAIEDAGFEIRDQIQWVYGCLSEDTEILTSQGWKLFDDSIINSKILIYDVDKDTYKWECPEKWTNYIVKDTAFRIQSNNTDQIVSRNHRCLVERNGNLVFKEAEALELQESIPFLEDLSGVQFHISNIYNRTSDEKQMLLKEMFVRNDRDSEYRQKTIKKNLPDLQQLVLSEIAKQKQTKGLLFQKLCRKSKRLVEKLFIKRTWEKESRNRVEGGVKPVLERWSNIHKSKGEICKSKNKVCEMPTRVYPDGKNGWVHNGTQISCCENITKNTVKIGGCSSHKPQCRRQQDRKFNAVQNKPRSQEIRSGYSYSTTLATITPIEYSGLIFCPTVSTGAFVARRNGKIFITGNSGFPKSLNISKAIDKQAGAERDIIKEVYRGLNAGKQSGICGKTVERTDKITAPATDAAKQWDGFGTALKPANEPICLARKPIAEKTIADNVLKYGTGAINIDGCRIVTDDNLNGGAYSENKKSDGEWGTMHDFVGTEYKQPSGRFPSNFIHDGSDEVVELFPVTKSGKAEIGTGTIDCQNNGIYNSGKGGIITSCFADQGSAARFFYCAKASPSERNEGLDDFDAQVTSKDYRQPTGNPLADRIHGCGTKVKNNHPTVKPLTLMRYLVRLVTPPNGICYDPFAGSGTTLLACKLEGMNFIGSEMIPEHAAIANARLKDNEQQLLLF